MIAAFRREMAPDDIVTVVDRDWGAGGGWGSLGFACVQRLPPASFYVGPDGERCHAMGTGRNPYRTQLPQSLLAEFIAANGAGGARTDAGAPNGLAGQPAALDGFLRDRGYFAVYGARALHCYAREQGSPRDPRVTQTRAHDGWPCY